MSDQFHLRMQQASNFAFRQIALSISNIEYLMQIYYEKTGNKQLPALISKITDKKDKELVDKWYCILQSIMHGNLHLFMREIEFDSSVLNPYMIVSLNINTGEIKDTQSIINSKDGRHLQKILFADEKVGEFLIKKCEKISSILLNQIQAIP